jgi:hypothetical protein
MRFHLDYETRSHVDLKEVGAYVYANHPSTQITHAAASVEGGERFLFQLHRDEDLILLHKLADMIQAHLDLDRFIVAHNAPFEYLITLFTLSRMLGRKIRVEPRNFDCTMARALAMALPGGLDDCAAAIGVNQKKDKVGKAMMVRHSKPCPYLSAEGKPLYWSELTEDLYVAQELEVFIAKLRNRARQPKDAAAEIEKARLKFTEKFQSFDFDAELDLEGAYCEQDVVVEEEIDKWLPPLSKSEWLTWLLDQKINMAGVPINLDKVALLHGAVQIVLARSGEELTKLTDGEITAVTQNQRIVKWLNDRGIPCSGTAKDVIDDLVLRAQLLGDETAEKVIKLRAAGGQSAVTKLPVMLASSDENGLSRYTLQYCGAATSRWSGRLWQPHNIKRISEGAVELLDELLTYGTSAEDLVMACDLLDIDLFGAIGDAMRSLLEAPEGLFFVGGDFSNIEGRGNAWLSGEEWKIKAFVDFDKGIGFDLYKLAYARAFGLDPATVSKADRQKGKVMELACFGPYTQVLTSDGWVGIKDVTSRHTLWDGQEWVTCEGVIYKGLQPVCELSGVTVTRDHLILTGDTWNPAGELLSNLKTHLSALATGSESWKSLKSCLGRKAAYEKLGLSAAVVSDLTQFILKICTQAAQLGAGLALKLKARKPESSTTSMRRSSRTPSTAEGYLTGLRPLKVGAKTRATRATGTMGPAGFASTLSGWPTKVNSWLTSCSLKVGTFLSTRWTGSTTPKGTSPVTFALYLKRTTTGIGERLQLLSCNLRKLFTRSKSFENVYDILNSGPRNRFVVRNNFGSFVAHNCGYQGGVGAFQTMAKNYGLSLPDATADILKTGWREAHPAIKGGWFALENAAIKACQNPGQKQVVFDGKVVYLHDGTHLWCKVPRGGVLCYPFAWVKHVDKWARLKQEHELEADELADTKKILEPVVFFGDRERKRLTKSLYGGLQCENLCQKIARDVLDDKMKAADAAGFDLRLHVHDELQALDKDPGRKAELEALMREPLAWCPGYPIAAECAVDRRYIK